MTHQSSIPYSMNSGNIKRDIKAIKNWVDADLKYQVWALNIKNTQANLEKDTPCVNDKKGVDRVVVPKK